MILAAGRGERMRPLTDVLPKPLLEVRGKALILWHIEKLALSGFSEIIINLAHLGHKIPEALGDGSKWNTKITYSDEGESGALESAGGILNALPLLGEEPFLVVNGDVFCDYAFDANFKLKKKLAHLILVPNPEHNPNGDFFLEKSCVSNQGQNAYTFSGIAYYHPSLFKGVPEGKSALAPLLREKIAQNLLSGELHAGVWHDIGTPQRLDEINRRVCL
jgi:MurNAc alpha-1-phosphate uridylyltransferase